MGKNIKECIYPDIFIWSWCQALCLDLIHMEILCFGLIRGVNGTVSVSGVKEPAETATTAAASR